jgi:hypothetical protein
MEAELVRQAEAIFGESMTRRLAERGAMPSNGPGESMNDAGASAADPGSEQLGGPPASQASDLESALSRLRMSTRQQRRLWQHVESIDNFWETLVEIEAGSIAKLASLASRRRWEIIFLTKRPPSGGATAQVQTQRWLQAKGFPLPSVYVVQGSRGRIASALHLDFVIDDTLQNCLDVVVDSKARAILVWREGEKHLPAAARRLGIGVVPSVNVCLDILAQVDAPDEKSSVIDRVRRLLGFKEHAS